MIAQRAVGAVSRALPRFHNPFDRWLDRHPGDGPITYRDVAGLIRTADLHDHLERAWFAGVPCGLPDHVLARILKRSLAIDVGANVGIVTGQLARRVTSSGRVWAIEPVPRNVVRLTELVERNELAVDVLPVAAGATDGELELRLPDDEHSGWASATASWIDSSTLTVPVRSLDSLFAERRSLWPVSFIKIDIEGYEAEVLAGAREMLARERPLLYVEFNDLIQRDRGSSGVELLEFFRAAGYRPATVPDLNGAVVDLLLEPNS